MPDKKDGDKDKKRSAAERDDDIKKLVDIVLPLQRSQDKGNGGKIAACILLILVVVGIIVLIAFGPSPAERRETRAVQQQIEAPKPRYIVDPDPPLLVPNDKHYQAGTEWFEPVKQVRLSVWGNPLRPNMPWRIRYNYDDTTIVHMPPYNSPKHKFVTPPGEVYAIEFSNEPRTNNAPWDDSVCDWIMHFAKPATVAKK